MNSTDFSESTLTNRQASAIIEAYRFAFPDFEGSFRSPFIKQEIFIHENKKHNGLFIFGNMIYFDTIRNCFVVRRLADGFNHLGELYMEEDSTHEDIHGVIKRIVQRQLDFRLTLFFENETDENGKDIPFSSRFECAMRGKKFKE